MWLTLLFKFARYVNWGWKFCSLQFKPQKGNLSLSASTNVHHHLLHPWHARFWQHSQHVANSATICPCGVCVQPWRSSGPSHWFPLLPFHPRLRAHRHPVMPGLSGLTELGHLTAPCCALETWHNMGPMQTDSAAITHRASRWSQNKCNGTCGKERVRWKMEKRNWEQNEEINL